MIADHLGGVTSKLRIDTIQAATNLQGGGGTNGTVVDQSGAPVANAKVKVYGFDKRDFSGTNSQIQDRIDQLQQEIEDATPSQWEGQQGDWSVSGDYLEQHGEPVALAHTGTNWEHNEIDTGGTFDLSDPQLSQPAFRFAESETVVLSLWQKSTGIGDAVDRDIEGYATTSGDITIEQLDPGGQTVNTWTVSTSEYASTAFKTHEAAVVGELSRGFYRVYPSDNEAASYLIAVGDVEALVNAYIEDLKTAKDTLSDRAEKLRNKVQDGTIETRTTTTNENGEWSVDLPSHVIEASVIAYKAPAGLSTNFDVQNATRADVRAYYNSFSLDRAENELRSSISDPTSINATTLKQKGIPPSVHIPGDVQQINPPEQGVTVRVIEISASQYVDIETARNITDYLDRLNLNETLTDLLDTYFEGQIDVTEPLDVAREQLWTMYNNTLPLVLEDPRVRDIYRTKVNNSIAGPQPIDASPVGMSFPDIRKRLLLMQASLVAAPVGIGGDPPETSVGNDTISVRKPFAETVEPEDVLVYLHWSNGSVEQLTANSSYVRVEDGLPGIGGSTVVLDEYPVNASDPAALRVEILAATDGGTGGGSAPIRNPQFGGTIPSLESIKVSSLQPGPDERVEISLTPASPLTYGDLTNVSVVGPSSTELNTTLVDGTTAQFTTNGSGAHYVELTFTNTNGTEFTETLRVIATPSGRSTPARITAQAGPTGRYAVVTGKLAAGDIERTGDTYAVTAQVAQGDEPPGEIHVYPQDLAERPETTVRVDVVRGPSEQPVEQSVGVVVHHAALSDEDGLLFPQDIVEVNDQAVPLGGSNAAGATRMDGDQTLIRGATQGGSMTVSIDSAPNIGERAAYWGALVVPDLNVPLLFGGGLPGPAPLGAGLAVLAVPLGLVGARRRPKLAAGLLVVVLLVGATAPAAALTHDDHADRVQQEYFGQPSYVVELDNSSDAASAIQTWADSGGDRHLVRLDNASGTAVVAAPGLEVTGFSLLSVSFPSPFTETLVGQGYVEAVHPNWQLSYAEPLQPAAVSANASEATIPGPGLATQARLYASGAPTDTPTAGLAFGADTEPTTPAEARSIHGVDELSETGAGTTVAVVDSGCNVAGGSRDTAGRVFGNGTTGSDLRLLNASKDFVENETVGDDGVDAVEDPNGHGTFVASQILANTSNDSYDGFAPDADLLCLRTLDQDGSGSTGDIVAAIDYAVDHDADVISMSLGSAVYSQALANAVERAYDAGVPVIVAAGNSRFRRSPGIGSPADADYALAVAATNESGVPAYFSQAGPDPGTTDASDGATQGEQPDLAAVGMAVQVKTVTTSSGVRNETLSGTSMAAPWVSGAAALYLDSNESAGAATVYRWLTAGAQPEADAAAVEIGNGTLDASNTVAENETAGTQADAMDDDSQRRNAYYEGASAGAGSWLPLAADARVTTAVTG